MPSNRNENGTFAHGNPGGPGRPSRSAELAYLDKIRAGCPPKALLAIVKTAVREAKKGGSDGVKWATWLTEQLGTKAAQKIEQEVRQAVVTAFTDDVSKILADPDATSKLLDAVQGHKNGAASNGAQHS